MQPQPAFIKRFFVSQTFSLLGSWVQQIALLTHVYSLDPNPKSVAWFLAASQIPILLLPPYAGRKADRIGRRKVWIASQFLLLCATLLLIGLYVSGSLFWPIAFAMNFLLGTISAFDIASRQAYVLETMQGDRDVAPAHKSVALDSIALNVGKIGGPLLSGPMLLLGGPLACFAANAMSFVLVLVAMHPFRTTPAKLSDKRYEKYHPSRAWYSLQGLQMSVGIVTMPAIAQFVPWSATILHADKASLGYLYAAGGIGALLANSFLTRRDGIRIRHVCMPTGPLFIAVGDFGALAAKSVFGALLPLMLIGAGTAMLFSSIQTLSAWATPAHHRARANSAMQRAYLGCAFVGSTAMGYVAQYLSQTAVWWICGSCALMLAASTFMTRKYWGGIVQT